MTKSLVHLVHCDKDDIGINVPAGATALCGAVVPTVNDDAYWDDVYTYVVEGYRATDQYHTYCAACQEAARHLDPGLIALAGTEL